MNITKKIINIPNTRNFTYHLFFLGDLHNGNICFDEQQLKKDVDYIKKKKHSIVFGMGDYNDCINYLDPRFDPNSTTLKKEDMNNCSYVQTKHLLKLLKPIQNKFIGFIRGNHEEKILKKYNFDVMEMITDNTGVPCFNDSALIRLVFKQCKNLIVYDVFIAHSRTAGRKKGNKLNLLDDISSNIEADIYVIGHNHNLIATKKTKLYLDRGMNIKAKDIILGTSGSYLKSYEKNASSYIEKTLFPVSSIGCLEIQIKPRKKEMLTIC